MRKDLFLFFVAISLILISSLANAATLRILGPDIKIKNNNIIVNISISNVKELEAIIKSGVEKEIVFTLELFRVWRFWPDEFVASKKIKRSIKYDNLREQYWTSSHEGTSSVKKYFKDYNTMKDWIFTVKAIKLANIRELEPGSYYIRAIVESKSKEYSSIVGFLMHLIPEVEMSLAKESQRFTIRR
jgi:hypothetical protein